MRRWLAYEMLLIGRAGRWFLHDLSGGRFQIGLTVASLAVGGLIGILIGNQTEAGVIGAFTAVVLVHAGFFIGRWVFESYLLQQEMVGTCQELEDEIARLNDDAVASATTEQQEAAVQALLKGCEEFVGRRGKPSQAAMGSKAYFRQTVGEPARSRELPRSIFQYAKPARISFRRYNREELLQLAQGITDECNNWLCQSPLPSEPSGPGST